MLMLCNNKFTTKSPKGNHETMAHFSKDPVTFRGWKGDFSFLCFIQNWDIDSFKIKPTGSCTKNLLDIYLELDLEALFQVFKVTGMFQILAATHYCIYKMKASRKLICNKRLWAWPKLTCNCIV